MSELKQRLKEGLGYVVSSDLEEMIKEFGENFIVCAKKYNNPRKLMSLKQLKNISNEESEDIREVFITSTTYREMFK